MNKNITQFLISYGITVRAAMKQLDSSHQKILFLVDENQRLIGSLTDGDIRRWILSGGKLDADASNASHSKPYYVREGFDNDVIKKVILKEQYSAVPVVDTQNKVINVIFWNEIFEESGEQFEHKRLDIPIVIMAGGQGTRLEPFTKILPKPLIPIGDKSIIEIIIDKFLDYHVNHFYISISHKAKIIKSFFEELSPSYTIEYIEEKIPLGTIGALAYLKGKVDRPILVTNCDIIIDANYSELLEFHKKGNYDISLVASMINHNIPYGICEIAVGGTLTKFTEKPEYSFLASTGMYIVNCEVLELISDDTFLHVTHLIDRVRENGGKVGVFPISEKSWLDTGEWHQYKKTLERLKI
jgi:dTDP-glucose pyrophosphorylase